MIQGFIVPKSLSTSFSRVSTFSSINSPFRKSRFLSRSDPSLIARRAFATNINMSKKQLTVSGFATCKAFVQAKEALLGLKAIYPQEFDITVKEFETRDEYMAWLPSFRESIGAPNHKTSPIVWFEPENRYLGGRDDTVAWARKLLSRSTTDIDDSILAEAKTHIDTWNPNHGYDYDLIVIGGGSGGLAAAKEATKLGAKVACLDYVKPSPHGTKWGLGGTCVNVGCIPKKLMHMGAQLGEFHEMSKSYGWEAGKKASPHDWGVMKEAIQDYIKGLNFGYRVQLREAGVTYMNKLGRFVSDHELECTDAKGNKQIVTGARFIIATGGRPSPLAIPGGEHAITSDDLFSLDRNPGKTLVVGAGYVALECGGFIAGLNQEVAVLVRSKPLRTFDQDTVKYVVDYMQKGHEGAVRILEGYLPSSIEKLSSGRLLVSYTNIKTNETTSEEFDTVLCAIGRTPDLAGLNIASLSTPLAVNEKSGKITTKFEQTTVSHVYAIGDIIHGAPELTPVAILAGKLLARRLFASNDGKDLTPEMVIKYKDIATAVFTPLEMGTVGYSEEEAADLYGADSIEAYISTFTPLEWAISEKHHDLTGFCKIIVLKNQNNRVIGMHIAAPGAGEIIQGYGVAMKKGLTYDELIKTVGIHPTVGEEFTMLSVTKSSGSSAAKAGC